MAPLKVDMCIEPCKLLMLETHTLASWTRAAWISYPVRETRSHHSSQSVGCHTRYGT